jgi:hypothetical protein
VKKPRAELKAVRKTAWEKYAQGDFVGAEQECRLLLQENRTENSAHHLLALVAHLAGNYAESIRQYHLIRPNYPERRKLAEAILWSFIHIDDIAGALTFLGENRFSDARPLRSVLERMLVHPIRSEIHAVAELPFTDDPLSPYMPGFQMMINGKRVVARLDTGGSFIHVSSALAHRLAIETVAGTKAFASLASDRIRYGFTDISLGSAELANVPVLVHEKGLSIDPIAQEFGIELGPIIGTNVLERFLATIDGPGKRLFLHARRDPAMKVRHDALFREAPMSVPFGLWLDHYLLVHGSVGHLQHIGLFVDSGLVVVDEGRRQASMMAPLSALRSWGAAIPDRSRFIDVPGTLRVGEATQENACVYPVSDGLWKRFGSWGGVRTSALLSWGFLKDYIWTIDFDERRFLFKKPGTAGVS